MKKKNVDHKKKSLDIFCPIRQPGSKTLFKFGLSPYGTFPLHSMLDSCCTIS